MRKVFATLLLSLCLIGFTQISSSSIASAQGVNNFEISDYQIDYYLGRGAEGRSQLKTVESISAIFPEIDQNHGIERAIPSSYDGHSTRIEAISVTDSNDMPLPYTTYSSNGNLVLRIGEASTYVHGLQTYKISYTQHDVTRFFNDTASDEFYWDTNGTGWEVPIKSLTIRLHLDGSIAGKLSAHEACSVGAEGSTSSCSLSGTSDGLETDAPDLAPYENITIAVGFKPYTFAPYKATVAETLVGIWFLLFLLTFFISTILIIWFLIRRYRRSNRIAEINVIVPEYTPPKDTSVSTAGSISRKSNRTFSAQLIDLAVRGYLKIYQTREKSLFKQANYELEITRDIAELKAEEQELLKDIFDTTVVGSRLDMQTLKNNTSVGTKLRDNNRKLDKDISGSYQLRARDDPQSAWFKRRTIICFALSFLTLSPWLFIAAITSLIIALTLKPLTDSGLTLAKYLKGLEMYIGVAEADRISFLQSPEGAARSEAPIDTNDKRQLIKIYERLLPYAILFGQEKGWNKQLGQYYQLTEESPNWYAGQGNVFNAVAFSLAMNSFGSVATSYSSPTSSSSGGSGGGGFSGGGGGGGGGGGW